MVKNGNIRIVNKNNERRQKQTNKYKINFMNDC